MTKNKYAHRGYEILHYIPEMNDSWYESELFIIAPDGRIIHTNKYNELMQEQFILDLAEEGIDRHLDELSDKDEYVYG